MAGHLYSINNTQDIALVGGTLKTVIQIATPATRRAWVKEASISFKSVTPTDPPVLVQLFRQAGLGVGGTTAITPSADIGGHPAALCSALEAAAAWSTTEPNANATPILLREWYVTPVGGVLIYQLPIGEEIEVAQNGWLGLVATSTNAQSCRGYLRISE